MKEGNRVKSLFGITKNGSIGSKPDRCSSWGVIHVYVLWDNGEDGYYPIPWLKVIHE